MSTRRPIPSPLQLSLVGAASHANMRFLSFATPKPSTFSSAAALAWFSSCSSSAKFLLHGSSSGASKRCLPTSVTHRPTTSSFGADALDRSRSVSSRTFQSKRTCPPLQSLVCRYADSELRRLGQAATAPALTSASKPPDRRLESYRFRKIWRPGTPQICPPRYEHIARRRR